MKKYILNNITMIFLTLLCVNISLITEPASAFYNENSNIEGEKFFNDGIRNLKDKNIISARTNFEKSCELLFSKSCSYFGTMLEYGDGGPKDTQKATLIFEKTCTLNELSGCHKLASMYNTGKGTSKNLQLARTFFKKACDGGFVMSCSSVAPMFKKGEGGNVEYKEAYLAFQKSCDEGLPWNAATSCNEAGAMLRDGAGVTSNKIAAEKAFLKSCDAGSASGCWHLVELLKNSQSGNINYVSLRSTLDKLCFKTASSAQSAKGCLDVGDMSNRGIGGIVDKNYASKAYEASCLNSDESLRGISCKTAGDFFYSQMVEVGGTNKKAASFYNRSCNSKNSASCYTLANMFFKGDGIEMNKKYALDYYIIACELGELKACEFKS